MKKNCSTCKHSPVNENCKGCRGENNGNTHWKLEELGELEKLDFSTTKKVVCKLISVNVLDKIRSEIMDTFYVDSLIFGELIDFKNGKISADDVIEEFNRVTRLEVLKVIDKYKAESEG